MRTGREATKREQLRMWEIERMVVVDDRAGIGPARRWKLALNSIRDPSFSREEKS